MSRAIIVILGVLILGFGGLIIFKPEKPQAPKIGQQHPSEGQQHISSVTEKHAPYKSDPPTSGPHTDPAAWGVSEVEIPPEQYVHNMEHGGVIIMYKPDLPREQIAQLARIAQNLTVNDKQQNNRGFKVLMTPRAQNTSPIQMSSWLWSLNLDTIDQPKIQRFYREHLNNSPEPNAA